MTSQTTALTLRQIRVIREVARGLSNAQIGQKLGILEPSVKAHVSQIMRQLGLTSRTQCAVYALQAGLIRLEDIDLYADKQSTNNGGKH